MEPTVHTLDINYDECDSIVNRERKFDVRYSANFSGADHEIFNKGDHIIYNPVDGMFPMDHRISDITYEITYVYSLGLSANASLIVLGIEPLDNK